MSIQLQSNPSPPSKQKFAHIFRILGRISFWVQLFFCTAAGIMLLLVIFSNNFSQGSNTYIGLSIFLAICSIITVGFRVYWAYRYTSLAKLLQSANTNLHPQRSEIIDVLTVGLYVSLAGLFIGFLATEGAVIAVLAKSLAHPQGMTVYTPKTIVRSLDLFLILADVNIMGAHVLGVVNSLGLLNWLDP
ncbi:MAG: DUF3611 family protein [Nostocaceae cyanobacterium]|nr:DUF3611 family protein [Nostocaceae cyanobacterium]